jgi:hypothetical protein
MDSVEYQAMIQQQDLQSLLGILKLVDSEKFPDRFKAVEDEIEKRRINGEMVFERSKGLDPAPKWGIQKNWHKLNAVIVAILSAMSLSTGVVANGTGFVINYVELALSLIGIISVILYFRKFIIGHYLLLGWWLVQIAEVKTPDFDYSVYSAFRFGIGFTFGPFNIDTNLMAIVSMIWLTVYKNYYRKKVGGLPEMH